MKNGQQVRRSDQAGTFLLFPHRLYTHRSRIWGKGGGGGVTLFLGERTCSLGYWLGKKLSRRNRIERVARYLSTRSKAICFQLGGSTTEARCSQLCYYFPTEAKTLYQ